jgi:hypothetical protein
MCAEMKVWRNSLAKGKFLFLVVGGDGQKAENRPDQERLVCLGLDAFPHLTLASASPYL